MGLALPDRLPADCVGGVVVPIVSLMPLCPAAALSLCCCAIRFWKIKGGRGANCGTVGGFGASS